MVKKTLFESYFSVFCKTVERSNDKEETKTKTTVPSNLSKSCFVKFDFKKCQKMKNTQSSVESLKRNEI